ALVLRRVGIGPADDLADVAELRTRRPDLLAVDDPLVAVAHGARLHTGEVGTGRRLTEQLTGDDVAAIEAAQVGVLHRIGGVSEDRGRDHAQPDPERRGRRRVELAFEGLIRAFVR